MTPANLQLGQSAMMKHAAMQKASSQQTTCPHLHHHGMPGNLGCTWNGVLADHTLANTKLCTQDMLMYNPRVQGTPRFKAVFQEALAGCKRVLDQRSASVLHWQKQQRLVQHIAEMEAAARAQATHVEAPLTSIPEHCMSCSSAASSSFRQNILHPSSMICAWRLPHTRISGGR